MKSPAQRRAALGLTQVQLAEALGVTSRTIQNFEAGAVKPRRLLLALEAIEARHRKGQLRVTAAPVRGWPKGKPRNPPQQRTAKP